jgi:spore coat protein U-like protein
MKKIFSGRKALGLIVLGASLTQFSAVNAEPMIVSATVNGACQLGVKGPVGFGVLVPGGADVIQPATIEYRCTNNTIGYIGIDDGINGVRNMLGNGANTQAIPYELNTNNSAPFNRWGDTGTTEVQVTGTGMAPPLNTIQVYGRVLSADYAAVEPAYYEDTVQVNISLTPAP